MVKQTVVPCVCKDSNSHTCIQISRRDGFVKFIPLNILGFGVEELGEEAFDRVWAADTDYPVERAAKLYAAYAAELGGSPEAMRELAKITSLSQEEISMATSKNTEVAAKKTPAAPAKKVVAPTKVAAQTKAAPAKKAAAQTKAAPTKKASDTAGSEKRHSAAQMFKDLIMGGDLTDDQIFAKVKKEFNLDDNKRSYVSWYRNDLSKKGFKPPAAKA